MMDRYVGEILVRRGALTPEQLDAAVASTQDKNVALTEVLLATRVIEEPAMLRALAAELDIPFMPTIQQDAIPPELIDKIPINFARQHRLVPIASAPESQGGVRVAVADPMNFTALDDLRALLGQPVAAVAVPGEVIEDAINRVYERKTESALDEAKEGEAAEELQDLIDMTDEAPVIRWVNNLFYTAVRDRASDIHVEPREKEVIVRYRIDGNLFEKKTANLGFLSSIVSRIKIEAGLNIAEKRLPQDGRITKKIAGKLIDVRVSTIPTAKGERIVMRLLDKQQVRHDLMDLGFAPEQLQAINYLINRPNGIILVTGPTGSGKTTTLYGCLHTINKPDLNILTVEDPVEYELPGIGQMQVQPKIGLTFASGLRAFLRQDPDVIMVGEIRDHETAEIAIHASLTGHLVLSTLHTNDAPGALTRLVEMEVQPFLISSSLLAVLAQRLVRRLCPKCRMPHEASNEDMRSLGLDLSRPEEIRSLKAASGEFELPDTTDEDFDDALEALAENTKRMKTLNMRGPLAERPILYKPGGCEDCSGTGYRGRQGIFELLVIDEAIRREILNNSDSNTVMRVAQTHGMRTLRQDGARQVLAGVTSLEEVLAATQSGEM